MNRFAVVSAIALIAVTAAPACTTTQSPNPSLTDSAVTTDSLHAAPVQADVSDDTFCGALRHAGIANTATLVDASDPAALLPALDSLAPMAPTSISSDFITFDHLEHVLLDPGQADPTETQIANRPETRDALAHIADYLHNTCRVRQ